MASVAGARVERHIPNRSRRCDLADEQMRLELIGQCFGGDPESSSHRYEPEVAFYKPSTDVVVIGHAHAPAPGTRAMMVEVRVGSLQKRLRVTGDRVWFSAGGLPALHAGETLLVGAPPCAHGLRIGREQSLVRVQLGHRRVDVTASAVSPALPSRATSHAASSLPEDREKARASARRCPGCAAASKASQTRWRHSGRPLSSNTHPAALIQVEKQARRTPDPFERRRPETCDHGGA